MRARPPLCAGARICDGRQVDVLTAQGSIAEGKAHDTPRQGHHVKVALGRQLVLVLGVLPGPPLDQALS
jgi:hypothetical protein